MNDPVTDTLLAALVAALVAGLGGLLVPRLIARVPQLLVLAERRRIERSQVQSLVRVRSNYFRHMRDGLAELHPANPDDPELDQ